MTLGRCRPLVLETPAEGGLVTDYSPTEANPHTDGIDAGAYFLQAAGTADSTCYPDRDPADGGMRFTDPVAGTRRQPDLVSRLLGAYQCHQGLLDIIHFLEDGPGDGWASGAYRSRIGTAPNPGGYVWWTSSAQTTRIIDVTYSYPTSSILASAKQWRLYASNGTAVLRTLTDTFTWSGPILTSTTRTWQ